MKKTALIQTLLAAFCGQCTCGTTSAMAQTDDYKLVWSDEFNTDGRPDTTEWNFEQGYARNQELQWYQADNAECKDGVLMITARAEKRPNPTYKEGATDWKRSREFITCTSTSMTAKREFLYGRFEVRARIPAAKGSWPAIWTLGRAYEWPSGGEIDIMEYYHIKGEPHILANVAWGKERQWDAEWRTVAKPYSHFAAKDPYWSEKFHIWRMDWDEEYIRLYLDDELLNEVPLSATVNGSRGKHDNPFKHPQYLLLNLAVGGINGGPVDWDAFPLRYEVDYVRVYQKNN